MKTTKKLIVFEVDVYCILFLNSEYKHIFRRLSKICENGALVSLVLPTFVCSYTLPEKQHRFDCNVITTGDYRYLIRSWTDGWFLGLKPFLRFSRVCYNRYILESQLKKSKQTSFTVLFHGVLGFGRDLPVFLSSYI